MGHRKYTHGVSVIWQVLLVRGPRDILGFEQIHNGADVLRKSIERIVVHSKEITGGGSKIILQRELV